jgi:hypothetical protein
MGTSKDNHHKRSSAARRAKGNANRAAGRDHKVAARTAHALAAYSRKKPTRALAIAAASIALLHAAIKVLTPTRN